jgi:hypothetical protein
LSRIAGFGALTGFDLVREGSILVYLQMGERPLPGPMAMSAAGASET